MLSKRTTVLSRTCSLLLVCIFLSQSVLLAHPSRHALAPLSEADDPRTIAEFRMAELMQVIKRYGNVSAAKLSLRDMHDALTKGALAAKLTDLGLDPAQSVIFDQTGIKIYGEGYIVFLADQEATSRQGDAVPQSEPAMVVGGIFTSMPGALLCALEKRYGPSEGYMQNGWQSKRIFDLFINEKMRAGFARQQKKDVLENIVDDISAALGNVETAEWKSLVKSLLKKLTVGKIRVFFFNSICINREDFLFGRYDTEKDVLYIAEDLFNEMEDDDDLEQYRAEYVLYLLLLPLLGHAEAVRVQQALFPENYGAKALQAQTPERPNRGGLGRYMREILETVSRENTYLKLAGSSAASNTLWKDGEIINQKVYVGKIESIRKPDYSFYALIYDYPIEESVSELAEDLLDALIDGKFNAFDDLLSRLQRYPPRLIRASRKDLQMVLRGLIGIQNKVNAELDDRTSGWSREERREYEKGLSPAAKSLIAWVERSINLFTKIMEGGCQGTLNVRFNIETEGVAAFHDAVSAVIRSARKGEKIDEDTLQKVLEQKKYLLMTRDQRDSLEKMCAAGRGAPSKKLQEVYERVARVCDEAIIIDQAVLGYLAQKALEDVQLYQGYRAPVDACSVNIMQVNRSTGLFEAVNLSDGMICLNSRIHDMPDPAVRDIVFRMGVYHGACSVFWKKDQSEFRCTQGIRDANYVHSLLKEKNIGIDAFYDALAPLVDKRALTFFYGMLIIAGDMHYRKQRDAAGRAVMNLKMGRIEEADIKEFVSTCIHQEATRAGNERSISVPMDSYLRFLNGEPLPEEVLVEPVAFEARTRQKIAGALSAEEERKRRELEEEKALRDGLKKKCDEIIPVLRFYESMLQALWMKAPQPIDIIRVDQDAKGDNPEVIITADQKGQALVPGQLLIMPDRSAFFQIRSIKPKKGTQCEITMKQITDEGADIPEKQRRDMRKIKTIHAGPRKDEHAPLTQRLIQVRYMLDQLERYQSTGSPTLDRAFGVSAQEEVSPLSEELEYSVPLPEDQKEAVRAAIEGPGMLVYVDYLVGVQRAALIKEMVLQACLRGKKVLYVGPQSTLDAEARQYIKDSGGTSRDELAMPPAGQVPAYDLVIMHDCAPDIMETGLFSVQSGGKAVCIRGGKPLPLFGLAAENVDFLKSRKLSREPYLSLVEPLDRYARHVTLTEPAASLTVLDGLRRVIFDQDIPVDKITPSGELNIIDCKESADLAGACLRGIVSGLKSQLEAGKPLADCVVAVPEMRAGAQNNVKKIAEDFLRSNECRKYLGIKSDGQMPPVMTFGECAGKVFSAAIVVLPFGDNAGIDELFRSGILMTTGRLTMLWDSRLADTNLPLKKISAYYETCVREGKVSRAAAGDLPQDLIERSAASVGGAAYLRVRETGIGVKDIAGLRIPVTFQQANSHVYPKLLELKAGDKKIHLRCDEEIGGLLQSLLITNEKLAALIQDAALSAGGNVQSIPENLYIGACEDSPYLVQYYPDNKVIGVDRALLDIQDPDAKRFLLIAGLHDLFSRMMLKQATPYFDAAQLMRDAAFCCSVYPEKAEDVVRTLQQEEIPALEAFTEALRQEQSHTLMMHAGLKEATVMEKYIVLCAENKLITEKQKDTLLRMVQDPQLDKSWTPYYIRQLVRCISSPFLYNMLDSAGLGVHKQTVQNGRNPAIVPLPGSYLDMIYALRSVPDIGMAFRDIDLTRLDSMETRGKLQGIMAELYNKWVRLTQEGKAIQAANLVLLREGATKPYTEIDTLYSDAEGIEEVKSRYMLGTYTPKEIGMTVAVKESTDLFIKTKLAQLHDAVVNGNHLLKVKKLITFLFNSHLLFSDIKNRIPGYYVRVDMKKPADFALSVHIVREQIGKPPVMMEIHRVPLADWDAFDDAVQECLNNPTVIQEQAQGAQIGFAISGATCAALLKDKYSAQKTGLGWDVEVKFYHDVFCVDTEVKPDDLKIKTLAERVLDQGNRENESWSKATQAVTLARDRDLKTPEGYLKVVEDLKALVQPHQMNVTWSGETTDVRSNPARKLRQFIDGCPLPYSALRERITQLKNMVDTLIKNGKIFNEKIEFICDNAAQPVIFKITGEEKVVQMNLAKLLGDEKAAVSIDQLDKVYQATYDKYMEMRKVQAEVGERLQLRQITAVGIDLAIVSLRSREIPGLFKKIGMGQPAQAIPQSLSDELQAEAVYAYQS